MSGRVRGIGRIVIFTGIDWGQMAGGEKGSERGIFLPGWTEAVITVGANDPCVCAIRVGDKVMEEGLARLCKRRVGRWDIEGDEVEGPVGGHGEGDMSSIANEMGWSRDPLAKACEGCGDEEGDTTRGWAGWKVVVEKARVRGTREENMVVVLGGDSADVPRANEVFVRVIKVCFLYE